MVSGAHVHRFIKTSLVSEKFHVLVYLLGQWKLGTFNYAPLTTLFLVHLQTWEYNLFTAFSDVILFQTP